MFLQKGEWKHLGKFYLATFLGNMQLFFPFYVVYFLSLGFSFFEIALMVGSSQLVRFLLEIPTGTFADQFSRKYSALTGIIIQAVAFLLIPFFNSFFVVLSLWVLAGIGVTLISGSLEAWVVDNLHSKRKSRFQKPFFYKRNFIQGLGLTIAWFLSGVIVQFSNMKWVFFITGCFLLLSAVVASFIPEHFKPSRKTIRKAIKANWQTTKKGWREIRCSPILSLLLLASIFETFGFIGMDGWQPMMLDLGLSLPWLGYLFGIYGFTQMLSPLIAYRIKNIEKYVSFISLFEALMIALVAFFTPPLLWLALIIYVLVDSPRLMIAPAISHFQHKFISKEVRATVISLQSMVFVGAFFVAMVIGGLLMDNFHIPYVIALGSLFFLARTFVYRKLFKNC